MDKTDLRAADQSNDLARIPVCHRWEDLINYRWRHQAEAVRFASGYLDRSDSNENAALVRMPTGTGKTGIMAILCNYFPKFKSILIVAPADFLTEQICDALNFDFWLKLKKKPAGDPKKATRFFPSTLSTDLAEFGGDGVWVCTTQTLFMLHDNMTRLRNANDTWSMSYTTLKDMVDLVIVDEGHREPAKEWARAVRSFSKPTILFSATPYRNDLRFFKVGKGENFRHKFVFQEAVRRGIIRDVHFKDEEFSESRRRFVDRLLDFFQGEFRSLAPVGVNEPKVIIRCEYVTDIIKIKEMLEKRGQSVLAVHDTFKQKASERNEFHSVPRDHEATFWVHQNKLAEGLDDSNFCLLAFFEPFRNARGLVQQIGRILRNPKLRARQKAIVFSDPVRGLREQWEGYLGFEKSEKSIVGPEEVVETFLSSLPEWFYSGGRYRQPLDLNTETVEKTIQIQNKVREDLRLRKSAVIYKVTTRYAQNYLNHLVEEVSDSLADREVVQLIKPILLKEGNLIVLLSCRIVQAETLLKAGFFDISLIPSVFYLNHGYLFYQGVVALPKGKYEKSLTLVTPSKMNRLLGRDPTITQVSLINCDLGSASVRRRSLGARSIGGLAPGLNDHFHFVSTAIGSFDSDGSKERRYLGLSTSRVTQPEQTYVDLDEFARWAGELAKQLEDDTNKISSVFLRFAKNVPAPPDAKAKHLLLELTDFFQSFDPEAEVFSDRFEATACNVDTDESFECKITETELVTGTVAYDRKRRKFILRFSDLDKKISEEGTGAESAKQTPSSYFTNRAVMRIVTDEYQLYADGHFYEPRQPLWGEGRLENLGILIGVPELKNLTTEKGEKGVVGRGTWQVGSIFHFIDGNRTLFEKGSLTTDILVCDDLGTEFGDFIAVDRENQKIAVIHAKMWPDDSSLAASDFQIINSQVVKSLEFLSPMGSVAPSHGRKWDGRWKWSNNAPAAKSVNRIRPVDTKGRSLSGQVIFNEMQELIKNSSTQKEVWIVLGAGFPIADLTATLDNTDRPPPYHVVQLTYLLFSCNSNVNATGATLKIFSSP
jgi:superfamily II DNA or RNA helicase